MKSTNLTPTHRTARSVRGQRRGRGDIPAQPYAGKPEGTDVAPPARFITGPRGGVTPVMTGLSDGQSCHRRPEAPAGQQNTGCRHPPEEQRT